MKKPPREPGGWFLATIAAVLWISSTHAVLPVGPSQSSILEGYGSMRTQIEGYSSDEPMFVAADSLTGALVNPASSALSNDARKAIESALGHPSATRRCLDFWTSYEAVGDRSRRSLVETLLEEPNVFIGTVTGTQPGFLNLSDPGTMLRVEIDEILRGLHIDEVHVFLPKGDFRVGNVDVCKTSPYYAELPIPGDQVVLLFDKIAVSDVVLVAADGIITLRNDGSVSLGRFFKEEPGLERLQSWELLDILRANILAETVR